MYRPPRSAPGLLPIRRSVRHHGATCERRPIIRTRAHPRPIRLTIPADFRYLRLARVTAAAIAADLDFSVQDIDDVRVAVDELAALLIEDAGPRAPSWRSASIAGPRRAAVEGRSRAVRRWSPSSTRSPPSCSRSVVDRYELSVDRGRGRMFRFWKQPGGDQG